MANFSRTNWPTRYTIARQTSTYASPIEVRMPKAPRNASGISRGSRSISSRFCRKLNSAFRAAMKVVDPIWATTLIVM